LRGERRARRRQREDGGDEIRDNGNVNSQDVRMTTLVEKAIAEEHHLEEIAREGYAPATLPIVLGAIMLALAAIVGLALAITLAFYYFT